MKTVGLITEYNPFHNGHLYHIEKAKELTGADRVVIIMSGDYVQRGMPALLSKHHRAHMALSCGASVVIELPVCYASGSAEYFALGAVAILDGLGCIDSLCFGSECGDLEQLDRISRLLVSEPGSYRLLLQNALKSGASFPAARCLALKELTGDTSISEVMSDPNNILGIEYLKALQRLNSSIVPVTLKRQACNYHDTTLQAHMSSASAIRNTLKQLSIPQISGNFGENAINTSSQTWQLLKSQLPDEVFQILQNAWNTSCPVEPDDFSLLLKYRLLGETASSLCAYQDVSPELANRIIRCRNNFQSYEQFCELLKTKELTYSRISRSLLHILLSITKEDIALYRSTSCSYARVLGFCREHTDILHKMKEHSSIPIITKLTQTESLSPAALRMLNQTTFASDLYESVITDKFGGSFINEHQKQLIRI